ncbi:MAG: hypothetical protein U9N14_03595, partial [Pseudomonadota bacterium]|nr:hypothetical protein [Pseudomonadota bacterium]
KGKAPQPYVFDPVLAKSAVSLDEWTKRLDCSPARATVTLSKQAPNTKSEDNDYNFGPWPRNEDQIERETKDHLRWTARPFEHPLNHGKAIELKSMKEIIDRFPARKKTAPKAASPSKAAIALKT